VLVGVLTSVICWNNKPNPKESSKRIDWQPIRCVLSERKRCTEKFISKFISKFLGVTLKIGYWPLLQAANTFAKALALRTRLLTIVLLFPTGLAEKDPPPVDHHNKQVLDKLLLKRIIILIIQRGCVPDI